MQIGQHIFDFDNNAYIMGILNITPDSFSDGGRYNTLDQALAQTERMIADGATIIDIGAESTRPGHTQISTDEEIERLVPFLRAIRSRFDVTLSVDCYRAATAQAAIEAGADLINDIWGLTYDTDIAGVIAAGKAAVCIMHNRTNDVYTDYFAEVLNDLKAMLAIAEQAGIKQDRILLDPGIGFAKSRTQDLQLLRRLSLLQTFKHPILLGTSRKRVLGDITGVPAAERDVATAATTVHGYLQGARVFRVHNVLASRQALDTVMAIEGS